MFLWMSSGLGGSYCDNCIPSEQNLDLAFCLRGSEGKVFGACCDDTTGDCTDDALISDCTDKTQQFSPEETCDELIPQCGIILGACCLPDSACSLEQADDCDQQGGEWLGANTLCSACPCITFCPPAARSIMPLEAENRYFNRVSLCPKSSESIRRSGVTLQSRM